MSYYVQITVKVDAEKMNKAQLVAERLVNTLEKDALVLEANWWDIEKVEDLE